MYHLPSLMLVRLSIGLWEVGGWVVSQKHGLIRNSSYGGGYTNEDFFYRGDLYNVKIFYNCRI